MELMKESDFRKEIKKTPRHGYLFFGEEDYLKAFALRHAKEVICSDETFSLFNEIKIDALDYNPQNLLNALMSMPMMADKKLVTLSGLNFNTIRPSELDDLCEVLALLPEYDYNILILSVSSDCLSVGILPKRPSATLNRLAELLTPVYFEKCSTAKLSTWVQKHFSHNGVEASTELCAKLPDYCGHSMFVLANEIDKLCFYLLYNGQTVATEDAMRLVCISANEYDAFAFTNAIMEGKHEAALAILSDYQFRHIDPLMIMGDISRVICDMIAIRAMTADGVSNAEMASVLKLHEFKVGLYQKSIRQSSDKRLQNALQACLDTDRALKLSPNGYTALKQLVCKI